MNIFTYILHIDKYLQSYVTGLGSLSYLILFAIIFIETGLVVVPFLPGDSLLFAAGTLAALGLLDLRLVILILIAAAILGDSLNYYIGSRIGPRAFSRDNARFFKPENLAKTQDFFEKHGGKTIILARFLPVIRTFGPFVAGIGGMNYAVFLTYNIAGGIIWVSSLTLVGFYLGNIPVIKENFEYAILGIVALSLVPALAELIRHLLKPKSTKADKTSYKELKETIEKSSHEE